MTPRQRALTWTVIGGAVLFSGTLVTTQGWVPAGWVAAAGAAFLIRGITGVLRTREKDDAPVVALRFQLLVLVAISIGAVALGTALLVGATEPDALAIAVFVLGTGAVLTVIATTALIRTWR